MSSEQAAPFSLLAHARMPICTCGPGPITLKQTHPTERFKMKIQLKCGFDWLQRIGEDQHSGEEAASRRNGRTSRLGAAILAIACLLFIQVDAFAQLPSPTYGWNLGNTLEATCGEGCWGPPATQALINSVAA